MLDAKKGLEELEKLWKEVESISVKDLEKIEFIEDKNLTSKIRSIFKGETVSYRYALLTQLLAKVINPHVNALAIQKKANIPGSFDARSFCKNTVVQFEKKYLENALGGSNDPYVSKPLRHVAISLNVIESIKDKGGWTKLYEILKTVQDRNDKEFTRKVLKQALLEVRRLQIEAWSGRELSVSRSPTLADIRKAIDNFLAEPSEGARAQAIIFALMRVINKRINAFKDIRSTKSTVADKYAGKVADIECVAEDGSIKLAISVTESLDPRKLKEELDKGIQKGVAKLIVVAHVIKNASEIRKIIDQHSRNIDLVVESITQLVSIFTNLLNEKMREEFIQEVATVLGELGYLDHLRRWYEILRGMKLVAIKQ